MSFILYRYDGELVGKSTDYDIGVLYRFVGAKSVEEVASYLTSEKGEETFRDFLEVEYDDEKKGTLHYHWDFCCPFETGTPEAAVDAIITHYRGHPELFVADMDKACEDRCINAFNIADETERFYRTLSSTRLVDAQRAKVVDVKV